MDEKRMRWKRRDFLKSAGIAAATLAAGSIKGARHTLAALKAQAQDITALDGESYDPVMETFIPNTRPTLNGKPNLHASELKLTPLTESSSVLGHPITALRDPHQDLELAFTRLMYQAQDAGPNPLPHMDYAQEIMDILLGTTRGRVYDGFSLLNFNRGGVTPDHVPGEYKMKALKDSGETVISEVDGKEHKIWEVTINMLWFRQDFNSDTFLLRFPYAMDPLDEVRIHWRIYSLIQEDLAPTTILNDGFGRILHGFDSTFTSIPAGVVADLTIKYPPSLFFRGIYNWGWGSHPPRVQFLQPVWEINEKGDLHPFSLSFATRNRESLTFEAIGEAAPQMKMYRVAEAALDGASGTEIYQMMTMAGVAPAGTFRDWLHLADDQRQLPPEAWQVLAEEDGLEPGDLGDYDAVVTYLNHEAYAVSKYAQHDTEGKGGVIRDWQQGDVVRVKVINLDNNMHYYRNVDFSARFTQQARETFGNGRFSFDKMNPKPSYGVPKVAEMQWRTAWGYVPHKGIRRQPGLFPRAIDRLKLTPFTDQFGRRHWGYVFKRVSGYWRFNPPEAIRAGEGLDAGMPLRDADFKPGVVIGLDTEGFGVAKMPLDPITTHPDQENFPSVTHPGFLKNPGAGGDIIPPTPVWLPFLVLHPETGTLKAPDGSWWVDQTYFHGRPVPPHSAIVAHIEAPRASAQLFYQFDPLFHDNSVASLHPRADTVR